MQITVYLPDEIGEKAKGAGLNLSGLLRTAVIDELERRRAMEATLDELVEYEVDMVDDEGRSYIGRITGKRIAVGSRDEEVFVTDDERVLVYDPNDEGRRMCAEVEDPAEDLQTILDSDLYVEAMSALGLKAIIDL